MYLSSLQDVVLKLGGQRGGGRKTRKARKKQRLYLLFFAGGGDSLVILKGFEGMFVHPLNGLKGLEASIFSPSAFQWGEAQEDWSDPSL